MSTHGKGRTMDAESRVLWERWKKEVRDEALEEAARECEAMADESRKRSRGTGRLETHPDDYTLTLAARRIRALKGES